MLTSARLTLAPLLLALCVFAAACDTVDAPSRVTAPTASLQTQTSSTGDVLYDLPALAPGQTFTITAESASGDARLVTTRTADGYALAFDAGSQTPTSVEVRYLYDGEEVTASRTLQAGAPFAAGIADQGPDSWHYMCVNSTCGWMKDYKNNLTGPGGGTRFTTPDGEVVTVTHVAFIPAGIEAQPPTNVRFESPSGIEITSETFGNGTSSAFGGSLR